MFWNDGEIVDAGIEIEHGDPDHPCSCACHLEEDNGIPCGVCDCPYLDDDMDAE